MNTKRLLPLALLLVAAPALADAPINQTRDVAADARISIENVKGEVNVSAWDRNQVRITGTLGSGARKLSVGGDAHALSIKVEGPESSGWFSWGNDSNMGPTRLNVQVPKGASLDVDVVSAPVGISGLQGGTINIDSVSGRIVIDARVPSIAIDSVSGSVELAGHVDDADVETVSGDIQAPTLGDSAKLETVSGRMRLGGGPFRHADLSTVSGDIGMEGTLAAKGRVDVETMSGDVRLALPATLSATISASTFSGELRSDFGTPTHKEHGPGSQLHARTAGGDGTITLESFSGDIRIEQR